jgi:hypothetical protein
MNQVATSAELIAYMSSITLPAGIGDTVDIVLQGLQGELETWLGYDLIGDPIVAEAAYVSGAQYDYTVDYRPRLLTQLWPIGAVTAVSDSAGNAVPFALSGTGQLRLTVDTIDGSGYLVTYTPGLPPAALATAKGMILRVASREMQNKHDDTRSTAGLDGRPPAPLPEGWQPGEMKPLSRWRRRGVFSRPRPYGPDAGPTYGSGAIGPGIVSGGGYGDPGDAQVATY